MSRAAAIDAVNHPRRACMRLVIKSSQSRRDPRCSSRRPDTQYRRRSIATIILAEAVGVALQFAVPRDLKLIHTATPDMTKLSCLCRVHFGGVNWIPGNSRLSPTENLKSEHVHSNRPVHNDTPDMTQTGPSCRVCVN